MAEFQGLHFEAEAGRPVQEGEEEGGEHDRGFKFGAVAVTVEVLEGGGDGGEDSAFPGSDVFFEDPGDDVDGMEIEVATDLPVLGMLVGGLFFEWRFTLRPLFMRTIGLHRVPADRMTFFAFTITSRTVRPDSGPSTPPWLFLDVQVPFTPIAFLPLEDSSNKTFSTL